MIWTSREIISKFRDLNVYFESLKTGTTLQTKLKGVWCILLPRSRSRLWSQLCHSDEVVVEGHCLSFLPAFIFTYALASA